MLLKKIILSLLFIVPFTMFAQSSCYLAWTASYNSATEEFQTDMQRCTKSSWPSRCRYEAGLSFDYSINQAGEAYYRCVGMKE